MVPLQLLFLGTAAATAFPLPFCCCPACSAARERGGKDLRCRASLLAEEELLIDLGPDAPASAERLGADFSRVRFLLQTHAHSDHFDPGHLITRHPDYAGKNRLPLAIAASPETLAAMARRLRGEDPEADLFSPDFQRKLGLALVPLRHGETVFLGEYRVTALESLHDPAENSLIFRVSKGGAAFLYGTDLPELSPRAWDILAKEPLDLAILDQTYGARIAGSGHLNADGAAAIADRMRREHVLKPGGAVYATHLSHEGNKAHQEAEALAAARGYHIAFDGLRLRAGGQ